MDFKSDSNQLQTPQRNRYPNQEACNITALNNQNKSANEFDSPKNEQLTSNSKRMMMLEFSPKQEPSNRHRNIIFSCEDVDSQIEEERTAFQGSFEFQQTACKSIKKKNITQNSSSQYKKYFDDGILNQSQLNSIKKGQSIEQINEQEELIGKYDEISVLDSHLNQMNIHTTIKKQSHQNNPSPVNDQLQKNLQYLYDNNNNHMESQQNIPKHESQYIQVSLEQLNFIDCSSSQSKDNQEREKDFTKVYKIRLKFGKTHIEHFMSFIY